MYTFTYNRQKFEDNGINKEEIRKLISYHHTQIAPTLMKNVAYYEGDHDILNRTRKKDAPNQKPVCNHAKDIADTATGFFIGSPISYTLVGKDNEEELDIITDALDTAGADDVDQDNALDMSQCGRAYEYLYAAQGTTDIKIKNLEATHTFMVCDDTIEQNELFAVYYYLRKETNTSITKFKATVCTATEIYDLTIVDTEGNQVLTEKPTPHFFGKIPIVEYLNNKHGIGDYEQQIGLMDAYNTLMADRVNDKAQFIDALLVLYGAILGDNQDETSEAMKVLKDEKLLELPEGSRAEYLTRTFDETGVEVLRKAIKEDIYTFSHVPNLTDENFVGNSSGVAMEYKLLGLMMLTNTKEKYYRKGLRKRLECIANYLKLKAIQLHPGAVVPEFTRKLPKNLVELSQMIANLKGTVSQKTLISQLDFVEDAQSEIDAVDEENEKATERQRKMFGTFENDKPVEQDE